jgi:hypothetical protein
MPISEESLASWAQGPKATEQEKCERVERAVKAAIAGDPQLQTLNVSVFLQGSYRNKTNVRQNSDVDICVRLDDVFFPDYPDGNDRTRFKDVPADITFSDFKAMVGGALERHFGKASVTRSDKAFKVHENTYRIDSDVVATFTHRRYVLRPDSSFYHLDGIAFNSDSGKYIINWPDQNYDNGLAKHERTGRRFRKAVRILKRLRDLMITEDVAATKGIASCLIEALVWNAPDAAFGHETLRQDLREVLAHSFNDTLNDKACFEWGEVNELKYLFRPQQPWTRVQAHAFLDAAWDRAGFE